MKNFQDLSVGDYLRILRRRIWYFVVPAVVVGVGVGVFVWLQPNYYKSETTIQVANRLVPDDYIGSLVRETTADRIEFVRQQVRSRTFVGRLVEDLQLAGGQPNVDAVVDGVGASITFELIAPTTFKL